MFLLVPATAFPAEKVITHQSVTQTITEHQLRSIFTMRRRTWEDGSPIHVFVLSDAHSKHKAFCKNTLGMFPHRLRKTWNRLVFTGTGQAPQEVATEQEMLNKIQNTPGSIGYLSEEMIDGTVNRISD